MCEHNCNSKSDSHDLVPVSRETLQGLGIKRLIKHFYDQVIKSAGHKQSKLEIKLYEVSLNQIEETEIIIGLQNLFPGVLIKFATFVRHPKGEICNIENIEQNMLHLINLNNKYRYIIVDWS